MPFTVIRGHFHIRGYQPDGDSIRFGAENKEDWALLSGPPAAINARGHVQLRLEGIDTLETHFKNVRQPAALGQKALDFLLHYLGIREAQFDTLMSVVADADEQGTQGYILAREVERNRRAVAFVFKGEPAEPTGSSIMLMPDRLRQSLNYQSIAEGLAYPTFYRGLFPDLRAELTAGAEIARGARRNIWAEDVTNSGCDVTSLKAITDDHVILPKLFRRLVEYLEGGGPVSGFREYLAARKEPIAILRTGHFTHFDTIVEVAGTLVRMTEKPENVVFES